MAAPEAPQKRLYSRRQFLTLAGAGAVVGAFILFATRNKGISGLLKTNSGTQTTQVAPGRFASTRQATGAVSSQSFFQKLFGGKL